MYQTGRKLVQHKKCHTSGYGKCFPANILVVDIVDVSDYLRGFDVYDKYLQIAVPCYIM